MTGVPRFIPDLRPVTTLVSNQVPKLLRLLLNLPNPLGLISSAFDLTSSASPPLPWPPRSQSPPCCIKEDVGYFLVSKIKSGINSVGVVLHGKSWRLRHVFLY